LPDCSVQRYSLHRRPCKPLLSHRISIKGGYRRGNPIGGAIRKLSDGNAPPPALSRCGSAVKKQRRTACGVYLRALG
jgi:hypothetical protein